MTAEGMIEPFRGDEKDREEERERRIKTAKATIN